MRKLFVSAAALLCAWSTVRAQDGGGAARSALTISLGVAQETRRDETDSPLAYTGVGPGGIVSYDWTRGERHSFVSFAMGASTIIPRGPTPSGSPTPPQEAFGSYELEAETEWRVDQGRSPLGAFDLGAEFGATFTVARHQYAGQDLSQQNFDFGVLTLGPIARWTRHVGPGDLSALLSVPLIAFADHPYADVRFAKQFADVTFEPLTKFHQASGEVAYAFLPESRIGLTATYRVGAMELDDFSPIHRVWQSIAIGVVKRFGARP
jgi:hypothetical protein